MGASPAWRRHNSPGAHSEEKKRGIAQKIKELEWALQQQVTEINVIKENVFKLGRSLDSMGVRVVSHSQFIEKHHGDLTEAGPRLAAMEARLITVEGRDTGLAQLESRLIKLEQAVPVDQAHIQAKSGQLDGEIRQLHQRIQQIQLHAGVGSAPQQPQTPG